jgi:hypothetical protein
MISLNLSRIPIENYGTLNHVLPEDGNNFIRLYFDNRMNSYKICLIDNKFQDCFNYKILQNTDS